MKKYASPSAFDIVWFIIFIDLLGIGILVPIIPVLFADPHSEYFLLPQAMSLSTGYILLGALVAIFPFMQFLATPILGQLSDMFGRRRILLLSLAGTVISFIMFAAGILAQNIVLLFIGRAFSGLTSGTIAVGLAAVADITAPENRARAFGLIGAAFGLGFICGPFIGGKLSDQALVSWFNAATPFWFVAILALLNMLLVCHYLPETLQVRKVHSSITWGQSTRNIVRAYGLKQLRIPFITAFLFQGGFAFFTTFFSVFLINKFSFTQGNIGDFFSYVGLWIAFSQAVLMRKLSARWHEHEILHISLLLTGVSGLLYFVPSHWWGILLVAPLFSTFNALCHVNSVALISRSVDASIQGEVLGINASLTALAQSIPPILSGFLAAKLGPEIPVIVSCIVIALAGLTFGNFYRPGLKPLSSTAYIAEA